MRLPPDPKGNVVSVRLVAFVMFVILVAVFVFSSIAYSPWFLLFFVAVGLGELPLFIRRLPSELRRRRLARRFPGSVSINAQADFDMARGMSDLVVIYGTPRGGTRPLPSLQMVATNAGLSFWTTESMTNPVASVPWGRVASVDAAPSARPGQLAIRVTIDGAVPFGLAPMSPAALGMGLCFDRTMVGLCDRINALRPAAHQVDRV
jgi:hypothetical protein